MGTDNRTEAAGGGSGHRAAWITAGATVLAALIAGGATLLASQDEDGTPVTSTPEAGAGTDNPSSHPAPTSVAGTGSQSTPADPSIQWQGVVKFDGSGKDLDAGQPIDTTGENDVGTSGVAEYELVALGGATVSTWESGSALPSYEDCASTVDAAGTASELLEQDTVLCVKTDEGRMARFQVLQIPDEYGPVAKFDAVIWGLPAS